MKISKELLKGSTSLLVLSAINSGDMYGYEIVKQIRLASDDVFHLNEGTLYPILHAMEKEHQVESYWQEVDGRTRKYYHITQKGTKIYENMDLRYAMIINYNVGNGRWGVMQFGGGISPVKDINLHARVKLMPKIFKNI